MAHLHKAKAYPHTFFIQLQAKEAHQVASMLSDEQPGTTFFALGVGRGVDRLECRAMIETARPASGCKYSKGVERYLDLFYKDDAPW